MRASDGLWCCLRVSTYEEFSEGGFYCMRFDQSTINQFPNCMRFIQLELSLARLRQNKKTWEAFVNACTVIEWDGSGRPTRWDPPSGIGVDRFANVAVTWQDGPTFGITYSVPKLDGKPGCAVLTPLTSPDGSHKGFVEIRNILMEAYEIAPMDTRNSAQLEATLLHECVHWARLNAGIPERMALSDNAFAEAGRMFEVWAYGRLYCAPPDVEYAKRFLSRAYKAGSAAGRMAADFLSPAYKAGFAAGRKAAGIR
jgi:hypothetical protein